MLYLETTKKAREFLGLGRRAYDLPGQTQSALGNWLLNIVPIGQRTAFLFMSAPSLLSFPIMLGEKQPTTQDIPSFMEHGLTQLVQNLKVTKAAQSEMLNDLEEIAICQPANKSLLGVFSGVAADYHARTLAAGDRTGAQIGSIILAVNSAPKATLEWKSPFEVAHSLLSMRAA